MSDVMDRLDAAMDLVHRGDPKAIEQLLWLWREGVKVDPEFEFMKHTAVVSLMIELCSSQPGARATLAKERDATIAALEKQFSAGQVDDLVSLSSALREDAPALSWFERSKDTLPRDLKAYLPLANLLERANRWAELGRFIGAPVELLEARRHALEKSAQSVLPDDPELVEQAAHFREALQDALRSEASRLLRALLAAGRDAEAIAVQTRALEFDPSPQMREALGGRVGRA
jgi:tetratricopeptide (TPR) repeat protein